MILRLPNLPFEVEVYLPTEQAPPRPGWRRREFPLGFRVYCRWLGL